MPQSPAKFGQAQRASNAPRQRRHTPELVTLCSATLGEDDLCEPPLGPLYIAAALEEIGIDVDFRDFQLDPEANGLSGDRLASYLSGHAPVVAISCFVDMLPAVIDATRQLHEARPGTLFVLGGPAPQQQPSGSWKSIPGSPRSYGVKAKRRFRSGCACWAATAKAQ